MVAFQDTPETAEELVNPPQGVTTVTGDFPSFDPGPEPSPPRTAPVIRSITEFNVNAPGGNALVITPPVGTQFGDTMLLSIAEVTNSSTNHITPNTPPTAPWSPLRRIVATAGTVWQLHQYIKNVWDDDPASHTFAISPNQVVRATLVVMQGQISNMAYVGFEATNNSLLTSHPITVPAIHPTLGPGLSIIAAVSNSGSWGVGSTGYTEQADFPVGGGPVHALFTRERPAGTSSTSISFTTSPSNRSLLGGVVFYGPPTPPSGYSGWLKLFLTSQMTATFNTYGSPMQDTVMGIWADPLPEYPNDATVLGGGNALHRNDDTSEEPYYSSEDNWGWSSILEDGEPITLDPGIYWIRVRPWNGSNWDPEEFGDAILTIIRIDAPPGEITEPARILLGDTDITDVTVWRQCELVMAPPEPQMGYITIRDVGQSVMDFVVGTRVTVDFGEDSRPIYTGYLIKPTRRHWFPVDKPDTLQRQWRLYLVDINILFRRRFTYRKADPPNVTGPKYLVDTPDVDAIEALTTDWLDLEDDDLDLTTAVVPVGNINDGQVTYPWNGAMSWGDAMTAIAQLPAAVYGLNPLRQLVYADVDDANAPFILSDRPGLGIVGYREAEIIEDGSQLGNDFLAWGAGKGSDSMVFKRLRDEDSIAEHGLWQDSITTYSIWKQSTINKAADSYINGSPQSKRGHKDDRLEVRLVIHENGLMVSDRVVFRSHIWGIFDVLPVRYMKITFATPYDVRYELRLSHEIDRWGFEDPMPPIHVPPLDVIPIDFPPIVDITIEDVCVTGAYNQPAFSGPTSSTGPFGLGGGHWGGGWVTDPDWFEGDLVFPGDDFTLSGGEHVNQLSPTLPTMLNPNDIVTLFLEEFDANGGPAAGEFGMAGPGGALYFGSLKTPTEGRTYEIDTLSDPNTYVAMANAGLVYNPDLTGAGTYRYLPPSVGGAGDSIAVTSSHVSTTINDSSYAARLPYSAGAPWNKDVITGRFRVEFDDVASTGTPYTCRLTYGAADVLLTVSADTGGGIELSTEADVDTEAYVDWVTGTEYFIEVVLNLPDSEVTVRVSEGGTLIATLTAATDGERVADASYRPYVRVALENTDAVDWTVTLARVEHRHYYSPGTGTVEFQNEAGPTVDGWGSPWTVYIRNDTPETDPGLLWTAGNGYGTVEVLDEDLLDGGFIQREEVAQEIRFRVSDYSDIWELGSVFFTKRMVAPNLFTHYNMVQFGKDTFIGIGTPGTGSGIAYDASAFFDGSPVNMMVRWSRPTLSVYYWNDGDPEPTDATASHTRVQADLSSMEHMTGIQPFFYENGQKFTLGPINGDSNGGAVFMSAPEVIDNGTRALSLGTGDGEGRHKEWPFSDPGDGRAYAVAWPSDVWTKGDVATPSYLATVVWGQFGDLGPGAPLAVAQSVASHALPVYEIDGVRTEFDVIIRGDIGLSLVGGSSGSGQCEATVVIKSYNYGVQPGTTPPDVSDYFIGWGHAESYHTMLLHAGAGWNQTVAWQPFEIRCAASGSNGGISYDDGNPLTGIPHFQWGVEILNAFDKIIEAGPFDQNGFLTPHWGSIVTYLRNVTYEVVPRTTLIFGVTTPCLPPEFDALPESAGEVTGETPTSVSTTVFTTAVPYIPMSLRVFVNGKILRWNIDFTETDPSTGTFTLTTAVDPEVDDVVSQYSADLT